MRSGTDTHTAWVEALSPWPADGFGTHRMRALLAELGDPQRAYPAVHVVGTNGKSTATRTVESLLAREGLNVGAYLSPHVRGWSERIRVGGEEADFERALGRVREAAERLGATQFEAVTAAALAEFSAAEIDAAVVEAGLGGRHDATNVLDAGVVLLTNVALDHTDVLGETRNAIACEKLAVAAPGATVVLPDREFEVIVPQARVVVGGPVEAASAFLGEPVAVAAGEVRLPGRLERRGESPLELWDGAHNPAGVEWLLAHLPAGRSWVVLCSILADKDAETMLRLLAAVGDTFVATESSSGRVLAAGELARLAARVFPNVSFGQDPLRELGRARMLAGSERGVLVTGSLYLLSDLYKEEWA